MAVRSSLPYPLLFGADPCFAITRRRPAAAVLRLGRPLRRPAAGRPGLRASCSMVQPSDVRLPVNLSRVDSRRAAKADTVDSRAATKSSTPVIVRTCADRSSRPSPRRATFYADARFGTAQRHIPRHYPFSRRLANQVSGPPVPPAPPKCHHPLRTTTTYPTRSLAYPASLTAKALPIFSSHRSPGLRCN